MIRTYNIVSKFFIDRMCVVALEKLLELGIPLGKRVEFASSYDVILFEYHSLIDSIEV